ncbi:hypothetical protein BaRGS_00010165, partial [Batillaria attramentaria]
MKQSVPNDRSDSGLCCGHGGSHEFKQEAPVTCLSPAILLERHSWAQAEISQLADNVLG